MKQGSPVSDESPVGPSYFRPDLPLELLQRSPLNPRKRFNQEGLDELAKSILELGIIEPLVVRPMGNTFEIVAGERRYRAALQAGLTTVAAMVKSLTDAQALEIMVVENNQREDVSALEEAAGFESLRAKGYDLDKLAERLGRSKKYVYDRIKLLDLSDEAKELYYAGKLTAGHAILIARLKPEDQARAIDVDDGGAFEREAVRSDEEDDEDAGTLVKTLVRAGADSGFSLAEYSGVKPRTVRELGDWIAHHVRFNPRQAAAAAPLEFSEVAERVDQAAAKPGRGKKVISITFEHFVQPAARDEADRTFGPRSFKFADGKPHRDYGSYKSEIAEPCEHAVLGVVAVGEKYGQAFEVCIARDKCQVHWKSEIATRAKNQKLRDAGDATKADKNEAREQATAKARREEAERAEKRHQLAEDRAVNQVVDGVKDLTPELLRLVLVNLLNADMDHDAFNARFKTKVSWGSGRKEVAGLTGRVLTQAVVFAALSGEIQAGLPDELFKQLKVDVRAIERAIEQEEKAAEAKAAKPINWKTHFDESADGLHKGAKTKSKAKKKR